METKPCNIAAQEKNNMPQCALKITHIGEVLFAAVLNKNPELMEMIAGKKEYTAVPEAIFTDREQKQKFDGEHKIDVLLIPKNPKGKAIPIELKLGKTRMKANKSEFGRFLTGYRYSEKYHKFTGSMISILSKKQAEGKTETIKYPLIYKIDNGTIKISDEWKLIVLTKSIREELDETNNNLWEGKSLKPKIFSFEELFEGNVNLLNEKVNELIKCKDYYKMWLGKV